MRKLCGLGLAFPRGIIVLSLTGAPGAATVGVAFSFTPVRIGGTGPFAFDVSDAAIPSWAALNAATGEVSGAPDAAGATTFTLRVTDDLGSTDHLVVTITVAAGGSGGGQLDFSDPANSALIV